MASTQLWWRTIAEGGTTCDCCGNGIGPDEPFAYRHDPTDRRCEVCAEREGVWAEARDSKRLRSATDAVRECPPIPKPVPISALRICDLNRGEKRAKPDFGDTPPW